MFELALDTSSPVGSIALGNSSAVAHSIEFKSAQRHSARLFGELMKFGLPRLQLDRVLVGLGPGSFSGIRVGLAAAQAIAFTQGVKVYGICSAFAVAQKFPEVTRLGVFADARRGEFYCTVFSHGKLERATYLLPAGRLEDEVSKMTLAVSAESIVAVPERAHPSAEDLLSVAKNLPDWQFGVELEPIYMRPPMQPPKPIVTPPIPPRAAK